MFRAHDLYPDILTYIISLVDANRLSLVFAQLDGIIIETTGMADPAPVIQTFFTDKNLSGGVFLDGVITVVDCKHIQSHLSEKDGNEAVKQVSYADRIILNKTDLVSKNELQIVNDKIFKINSSAQMIESVRANVDIKYLMNIRAFEVDRILKTIDPSFLEVGDTSHHHDHHDCEGDSCSHHSHDDEHEKDKSHHDHHHEKDKSHRDHHHHHHGHRHKHENRHSSKVSSVGIAEKGNIDYDVLVDFLTNLLLHKGKNIYRMKGVINMDEDDLMYVFQGVHQLWDLEPQGAWGVERKDRVNKVIFIGEKLNRSELVEGFRTCIVGTPEHAKARQDLVKMWHAQAFWNAQTGAVRDLSSLLPDDTEYEVNVHNGAHGMGMLLSERKNPITGYPEVFVAGFVKMQDGVPNNALDSGLILPGDTMLAVNGTNLSNMTLKEVTAILRQLPRGAGISGANVAFRFKISSDDVEEDVSTSSEEDVDDKGASTKTLDKKRVLDDDTEPQNVSSDTKKRRLWKS